ncbi:helicase UvrD [Thioclava dalianensis]|uniref:DNA 3'-5' helicase n=1 Tax=Thioclava dalianensis TaxID=1185766 RepID=A0A074U6Q6_9RHOB|nr:double-strand break repair helicase AddA [Thioclava dalianensis]KEP70327.1 helicase UvrD [Thioclava dalianensis]SFN33334.1 DNA helicase/exodeoxyribonuclease V, subunit A [Thioclava dalianensis]
MSPNDATERQIQASMPKDSVWLSANAGSGKTKVLTDRVARMLLNGTEPQRILCLTYTKAAAAEMQNRLLALLGEWAMMAETELRKKLEALGEEGSISAERLNEARRLFAKAIETPGGLKIQTIHAFCASLLRRFPLEAQVPHGFSEMDDRAGDLMREDILEAIASGEERPVLDALLMAYSAEDLGKICREISQHRDLFLPERSRAEIFGHYGLPETFTRAALLAQVFEPGDLELVRSVAPACLGSGPNDQKVGRVFAGIETLDLTALAQLADVMNLKKGASVPFGPKGDKLLTQGLQKKLEPGVFEALKDLAERVAEAREPRLALAAAERSELLHAFARAYLPRIDRYKAQRGWLDFDDLIQRAAALLSNPSVAQWVLFKLDGGIDHILVDEAQDTSPGQWHVIERIADEFTSGEGARDQPRSLFVVGDRKQSIYSFQGADLAHFEAMQRHFVAKFEGAGDPLRRLELEHSFRSSAAILRTVDESFKVGSEEGLGGAPHHIAFQSDLPGRVDLWPVVAQDSETEETDWSDPVDQLADTSDTVILARAIAAEIKAMIDSGVQIPDKNAPGGARAVHEGDFLILVRRRSALFAETIRACKAARLNVAGADRLKLGAELAVRDVRALLSFLATPEDDLSLAEALRSPLLCWSEQELYSLAQPREGFLWEALRKSLNRPDTLTILRDLRDNADFLRPFELIERLLTRHGGRERLLARLGPEAEDGIDELISQALAFERNEVPSLTGFLDWLEADEVEVKRQLEGAGRAIRVMTVHGSKGLEAPIVLLPDTALHNSPDSAQVFPLGDALAGWSVPKDDAPEAQQLATEARRAQREAESLRLLYVAMTRAEKWLIVAASGKTGEGSESWYSRITEGLDRAGTETVLPLSPALQAIGEVQRHSHGDWPAPLGAPGEGYVAERAVELPDWVRIPVLKPEAAVKMRTPSDLEGAKALPGEGYGLDEEAAKARGRQLHLLLEYLPQRPEADWVEVARSLLSTGEDALLWDEIEPLLDEARRVLHADGMAEWLGPGALAEVEFVADLPELGGARLHGIIDRLVVTPEVVRVLDYKSNAIVPQDPRDIPEGLVRQMAAYRSAMRQIHPGRPVQCAILWTASGTLMPLADAQLDAALRADPVS